MKVEIVDGKTFMVGEQVYEVGDEVKLLEAEQAALSEIVALEKKLSVLKQTLVDACHLADRNFIPGIGDTAHDLSRAGIEFSFKVSIFVNDLHRRIGGLLPIVFNEDKTKVLVRERKQDGQGLEDVNYTVSSLKRSIKMNMLEDQRLLAINLTGDKRLVKIDMEKNSEFHFQPIEFTRTNAVDMVEGIKGAVIDLLEKRLYLSETMVLYKAGPMPDKEEGVVVNLAVQSPDPSAQRDRWDGIVGFSKKFKADSLAVVSRKAPTQPRKGASPDPETVLLSFLGKDGKAKTFSFEAEAGPKRKFNEVERTSDTFDIPGGVERYLPLLS